MARKTRSEDEEPDRVLVNLNLKISDDERWAFKEWCVKHRISQVDGFRRAFELLKRHGVED